ncbi:hypothetical protein [Actinophytocola sp.]|uniref:hypothetical protein n=1 Tax=Actinophytocola sp. TaxID=1872138 RepID=UPI002ED36A7C
MRPLGEQDPRTAGQFRLLAELGEDETGRVMLGQRDTDVFLIKLVHTHVAEGDGFRDRLRKDLAERDPRVRPVVEGDADAPVPWAAVEYVPSASLREFLAKRRPFSAYHLLWLATGLARALKKLHGNGLAHGELTPAVVRLTGTGTLLIDVGTARAAGACTPADDVHALGVLLESASERPLPGPVRRIVAACTAPAAKRPSAAELLKMIKGSVATCWHSEVHNVARDEVDEIADLITQIDAAPAMDGWLRRARDSINGWPGYRTSKHNEPSEPRFIRKRPRSRAELAEEAEQRADDANQRRAQRRKRLGDGALILATAAFAGWVAGKLAFGGVDVAGLPNYLTLGATVGSEQDARFYGPIVWATIGPTMGVVCAVLLLFIGRPRTRAPVWTVLALLSASPVVLWALNTLIGLDIDVITVSSGHISDVGELLGIILGAGALAAARKLFPDAKTFTALFCFLTVVVAAISMRGCLAFGWMGIVIAGVIRVDVATLLVATIAGSVAYRNLRPAA